jgi:hypothetical protein
MPQKTNLNINPYYDDFDPKDNFYRVLFKPGFPVQARELTTLQSILQNQVESFGSHIFKEGSMVIPGSITYDSQYYSVKINPDHSGIDVSLYISNLVGKTLQGQSTGNTAKVVNYLLPPEKDIETPTLYVKYLSSNDNFEFSVFDDGEELITLDTFVYGNTTVNSGDTVATLIDLESTSVGSAVGITTGVYFLRGNFVNVDSDTLIISPYDNSPSYRVGLLINEEIVSAGIDTSLYDNAKGFSNYAAPGADRLKISTTLSQKELTDYDDKNFVELIRLDNGEVKKLQDKSQYSLIKDYFAKRTFEESGDYSIDKFKVEIVNSLNDRISNDGLYLNTQKTDQGNDPSDDLMCVKVSAGKAYVRGYDIDIPATSVLDVAKPRDTRTISSSLVPFEMGNKLRVNNVYGTPFIGIDDNSNTVELYNQRRNSTTAGTGTLVGKARVYSFATADLPYASASTEWDLYLFDIQTYTTLTLNETTLAADCPATSFIRGLSSGATGYVVGSPSSATITLDQTSGTFIVGEQILINETTLISRSIKSLKTFSVEDIKSVYQDSTSLGLQTDFVADTVLQRIIPSKFSITDKLQINNTGIATCAGKSFLGIRSDAIIRYQVSGSTVETFNRVSYVSADGGILQLATVPNVTGVCNGSLPSSSELTTFSIGSPQITNQEEAFLYAAINESNISSVDLSGSNLLVSKQITGQTTDSTGSLTLNVSSTGISSAFFENFDSERYSVFYADGTIEDLTSDQFSLSSNGTILTLSGLTPSQSSNVTLNVSVKKNSVQSKTKNYVRSQKLTVNKVSSGISTALSGLTTSNYYGLRIDDREISLNVPDVAKVISVYESLDSGSPTFDKLSFVSGLSLDTASILGEKIIGETSGAVAQLVTRYSSTEVEIVYLNSNKFSVGETVTFEESNIISNIVSISLGNYLNVTNGFSLDKGQKEQYYDYSKLVRKSSSRVPSRQLLVVYDCYQVPSNDNGDVYTVNSYSDERFEKDIPILPSGLRSSDTLDFRPRVADFISTTSSPFAFTSRNFAATGTNPTLVVSPGESSLIGYANYLPRRDKVVLDKFGNFSVIVGSSSLDPKEPVNVEEAMDIAYIDLPAYLYDPSDAKITLVDNKRYTMRDIGKLEDRIENLEVVTSLSLLELNTKSLQIQDADGLTRFKSGFFVDDFKNNNLMNISDPDCNVDIDREKQELNAPIDFYSLKTNIAVAPSLNQDTVDYKTDLPLLDSNVRKTGDLITLNYEENGWIEQPLASRVENINPFNMIEYKGSIKLNPASDNWVRTILVPGGSRTETGGWDGSYIENVLISSVPDTHMRSRNIEILATGIKPLTRYYSFLDGSSGIDIIPKLIEISMSSGTFQIGETIDGFVGSERLISFRAAQPNHKSGAYNNPSRTYSINPYNKSSAIGSSYSASSTILNVDTTSLCEEATGNFFGRIDPTMVFVGRSSGAEASITNIRLISDNWGDVYGSFYIRNPLASPPPLVRITTGTKSFKVTSSPTNATPLPGSLLISSAETSYSANGIVNTFAQVTVVVRRPPPPPPAPPRDPLSQTFTADETGAFLTSIDLYFASKDENEKIYVELRTVELGTPTNQLVQDYASVEVYPDQITTSTDASIATNIKFPSPVYLQPNTEYAVVLLSPSSDNYEVWCARMGEKTVNTQSLPNPENVLVTRQYTGGSLFKSQNGTIWTASQFEDMKFKLYKANFTSNSGTVTFYNPSLGSEDENIPNLDINPIKTLPRKLRVGVTTETSDAALLAKLIPGTKINKTGSSGPIGYIEKVGSRIATISTTNVGSGYSTGTFTSVPLYSITGSGSGAQATVSFHNSGLTTTTITTVGNGYAVGDILGITTSNVTKGKNAKISVASISGVDTLYLTNVQGESFATNDNLQYYNGSTTVALGVTVRENSSVISNLYDGRVIEIAQYNHGMHQDTNKIVVLNVEPNTVPTTLTASLGLSDTTVSVANTSIFATFEGITTSRGYAKINNEVIYYNSIGSGTLGIGSRGKDLLLSGTRIHDSGDQIYKYELNGISLSRINTTHTLPTDSTLKSAREIDTYHLQIDRTGRSSGDTQMSFTDEKSLGGSNVSISQNFQFNGIIPQYNVITPGQNTTVSARIRTVSGTSAGGSEISFIDQGYESVELNQINYLDSTRLVCSEVNEEEYLTSLPKNKSLTVELNLSSVDPNLSPVIDTQTAFVALVRNRVNNPIISYPDDSRVNQNSNDPHSAVYISNRINLKQPASSLKVLVGAYRHSSADFRVLYKLYKADSGETEPVYELFPGYDNLSDTDGDGFGDTIIDSTRNSGLPDAFVRASRDNEFLEYQFSAENLDQFTGFAIKIVMNGTDEAYPVKLKDLRVIALA